MGVEDRFDFVDAGVTPGGVRELGGNPGAGDDGCGGVGYAAGEGSPDGCWSVGCGDGFCGVLGQGEGDGTDEGKSFGEMHFGGE